MKCDDLLKMLNGYVEGELDPGVCDTFEKHLAGCNPCRVVVDSIRKTITLYQGDTVYEIPMEFRNRLHDCLEKKWKERHGEAPPPK